MGKLYEQQLEDMKRLINYGVKENKNNESSSVVEFHTVGADGKTYGIIRECNKFYIKVAPKKDTPIVAEDYDYIGGFMNRKEYEYNTYPLASKQFDLKMKSLNEAYNKKEASKQFKQQETSEWQIAETKEMRAELNRYNEIVNNVGHILKEGNEFKMEHTLPEAPKTHPSQKEVNSPFTDTAVAKGDKDFKETQTDYKKAGGPYVKDGEVTDKEMTSDKKPKGSENSEVYSEKAKYVPENSIADKKPSGGKSVKMNEGKRTIKITEEQVLAWSKSKDFMDKTHGTEIGDTAPYTENVPNNIQEGETVHDNDSQNSPKPGVGEIGDTAPYDKTVNEDVIDVDDVAGMPNDVPFPEVDDEYFNEELPETEEEIYIEDETPMDNDYQIDDMNSDMFEAKVRKIVEGIVLNDFGKHPAYQKVPMTTPPNADSSKWGEDWNDDSTKGEEPFGKQIGDTAPYTEKVVDMITDAIYNSITNKKKS